MFRLVRPGIVKNDEGFEVRALGRTLQYLDGSRTITIDVEPATGGFIVELGHLKWDQGEALGLDELPRVQKRIADGLTFMKAYCRIYYD